jgi:uncharacterized protein YfaS (alpha-2-macroglobulin family)
MNHKKIAIQLTLFLILGIYGCKNSKKIIAFDPRFSTHINGYTSGMISAKNNIRVELAESTNVRKDTHGQLDSNVLKDIFSFSPKIKGKAVWLNERTIEFIPAKPLNHGTFYNATFHLNKIKAVEKDLKRFRFQFSTYEQHLYVTINGLYPMDEYNVDYLKLEGKIKTTDKENLEDLKKTISVSNKNLNIRWGEYFYGENEIDFYIDSIQKDKQQKTIQLSWNGSAIKSSDLGSKEIKIPAHGDYTVTQMSVIDDEEQYLEIEFSEALLINQNLLGLVKVENIDKLSFAINRNKVKVFFEERILGIKNIEISTGIKNIKGHNMSQKYIGEVEFLASKPRVRLVGNGNILPNSQGLIFPFEAINLKSVDIRIIKIFENNVHQFLQINDLNGSEELFRTGKIIAEKKILLDYNKQDLSTWSKHVVDLKKIITPDPGCIYRVSIKFGKSDAIITCADENTENTIQEERQNNETSDWNEESWNYNSFDDYETWESYYDEYSACEDYYYQGKAVSRNIIASDIGIIFKLDQNQTSHTYVRNLITTAPIATATIEFYDYAKQLIAKGIADDEGKLDLVLSKKPFLIVIKNGKQRGYMKLIDAQVNALSKFDIEGEQIQKGIKGFIYTDRGVWRPGDSIYINFIVEDKQKKLPNMHPVFCELRDPNGVAIFQSTKTNHINHTYDFRTATLPNAVTGLYLLTINIGNNKYTKNIHIETVKPNRLKIDFDINEYIYENEANIKPTLSAKWLHGATAKNLKANVTVQLKDTETKFNGFKNYIFNSPIKQYNFNDIVLFDNLLDSNGATKINCNLHLAQHAPGMVEANFITKVFEESGNFSIDKTTCYYSPFSRYVGISIPNCQNNFSTLEINKNYSFDIASVNQNGTLENTTNAHLKIYKIDWHWWYESYDEDASTYLTKSSTILIKDSLITSTSGKSSFKFIANEDTYARYLFIVTDKISGHQTGKIISFDYPSWQRNNYNNSENASMLNFSSNKKNYLKGEVVKLKIPSNAIGKALISIETSTKVLKSYWINTKKGETNFEFVTTEEMCPNVYVHITMIQPHAQTLNDLPIRMYGVIPILVDDINTHLHPIIEMQDVVKPEATATIQIHEKNSKKMTYTIAIVDEGLLDLTNFKTPNPWNVFYAKEALNVKTWDMYDEVIGAYSGKLDRLISIGGDGAYDGTNTTKSNRFEPMVRFLGPFTIEKNQKKLHQIKIPNTIGSARVMVVAQNEGAYGCIEKTIAIKKPLMLLATLPRVLSPNESISLPINIFALDPKIKDVKIALTTNDFIQIKGSKEQHIHFNKTGDEIINFNIKIAEKVGIAKINIVATSGTYSSSQAIEITVRHANPPIAESKEFTLAAMAQCSTILNLKNIKGTNKVSVEISNIPSLNLDNRLEYLIQYPHGCIEQTTSAAFPQLYLAKLMSLSEGQQNEINANIKKAILRLQHFQTPAGGFAYWPGEREVSEYGSNYAGHFMLEAEKQGYNIPIQMKQKWIKYQSQKAKEWNNSSGENSTNRSTLTDELLQSYRLYTLALSGNAELGAMNNLRVLKISNTTAAYELALAYQTIGQMAIAQELIKNAPTKIGAYKELSNGYGSDTRDQAIQLLACNKLKNQKYADLLAIDLGKKLNSNNWYSTQETAYCMMALCSYYGIENINDINISYKIKDTWFSKESNKSVLKLNFQENDIINNKILYIKNNNKTKLYVKITTKGIPLIGDSTTKNNHIKMTVDYMTIAGSKLNITKIKQGTDFYAVVKIENIGTRGALKELCLNEIFPSGWEIHNSRLYGGEISNAIRYQDIRDDRVYSYFDLEEKASITVKILLNATYLGTFYLPSIYSEAMYDNTIHANSKAMWVSVVK